MNKKSLVGIITFLFFIMMFSKGEAFHDGGRPADYNFDAYLKKLGIPKCKEFYGMDNRWDGNICVNQTIFEGQWGNSNSHQVVYGEYWQVGKNYNGNTNEKNGQWRYIGLTPDGVAVPNVDFPDDITRDPKYLAENNHKIIRYPWDNWSLKNAISSNSWTSVPYPRNLFQGYNHNFLGGLQDTVSSAYEGRGDFAKNNWVVKDDNAYPFGYRDNGLNEMAELVAPPRAFSKGVFHLYTKESPSVCSIGYCYSSYTILPLHMTNERPDAQCWDGAYIKPDVRTAGEEVDYIPMSVGMSSNNSVPVYRGVVYFKFAGGTTYQKEFTIKNGQTIDLDLSTGTNLGNYQNERLRFPDATGDIKFTYNIRLYDEAGKLEDAQGLLGNNDCATNVRIDSKNNSSVKLQIDKTKYSALDIAKGSFVVKNDYQNESIDSPVSNASGHAKLNHADSNWSVQGNQKANILLYKDGTLLHMSQYNYSDLGAGESKTIPFDTGYAFTEPGKDYKIMACIPVYQSQNTASKENPTDNCDSIFFEVDAAGDVSIDLSGKSNYEADTDIQLRHTIVNKYPKNHTNVPITLTILNKETNQPHDFGGGKTSITYNQNDVPIGATKSGDTPAFKLPYGSYKATVTIPHYPAETNYDNNTSTFEFTVLPFTPDSVECKIIPGDQVKIITGDKGVSRFCIGQTPNYPSTEIEKGQGTFFFVMYRILPMPLPPYEVTNLDELGIYQEYKLSEQSNERGIDNSFIFYPNGPNKNNLAGPYKAGPHSYEHYLYRGRLLPTEVSFDIKVSDPTGKAIPEASGTIYYKIDQNKCYSKDNIDMKSNKVGQLMDSCRQVFFYLPREKGDSMTIKDLSNLPNQEDRLHFKNPGMHTFQIKANEKQTYFYQKDNGAEWQGNVDKKTGYEYLREPWKGDNGQGYVNTNTVVDGKWISQENYNNHCYSDNDAFDRFGEWLGTNFKENGNKRNKCYHNSGKDWHFWRFDWSKPQAYGTIE